MKTKEIMKIDWAEVARKHEAFSHEFKTYRLHEVVSLWFKVNSENLDYEELTDEICGFVDDVLGDHVINPRKLKLKKELW
jgi:hypothetical protein